MEDDADLALLDQHLLKTNLLSQRMTNILGQLDTRLSRLDKTIAPLGLQPLTRKATNIDAALASMQSRGSTSSRPTSNTSTQSHSRQPSHPPRPARLAPIAPGRTSSSTSSSTAMAKGYSLDAPLTPIAGSPIASNAPSRIGTPADETAILSRGPDIMALGEYFASMDAVIADLERMWRGLMEGRGGAREAGVKDLSKLVEVGFGGLVELFLKITKEGTTRLSDLDSLLSGGPPTPPNYFSPLQTVLPLSTHMAQYCSVRSNNPKTQETLQPFFDTFTTQFSQLRFEWLKKTISPMLSRVEEVDEGGIWEAGRGKVKVIAVMSVWEVTCVLIEAETLLITTLFPAQPPHDYLTSLLQPMIALITAPINAMINTIKRAVSSHAFVALDLYQSLTSFQPRWDQSISKCFSMTSTPSSSSTKEILSVLQGPISTFRQLSMRSFPELLVDIRMTQFSAGKLESGICDTTYSTLSYLEALPQYQRTIDGLLSSSQSQRSWLMGQTEYPSPVRSADEEGGIVNLFVADILGTLIIHLNSRATAMKKPVGQALLLNNLSHVRNTTASFTSDIIGPGAEDMLNKAFRDAKSQYLAEWTSLTSILTSSTQSSHPKFIPGGGGAERQLKESSTSFYEKLNELEGLCTNYPLSRSDPDLRDRLGKEVAEMVSMSYGGFVQRCAGKAAEKYLRGSPEEIQRRVQTLFR